MHSSLRFAALSCLLAASACGDSPVEPARADQIAFLVYEKTPTLHLINTDGTGLKKLETTESVFAPEWSPDGRRIAFIGWQNYAVGIYVVNADGSGLKLVIPDFQRAPVWHPNGRRITYVEDSSPGVVVSVNLEGGDRRVLFTDPGHIEDLAWSPDGNRLAFINAEEKICIARLGGSRPACYFEGHSPAWSPDGRVAFSGFVEDEENRDVYVMDADGGNRRRLTRHPGDDWGPSWSPDGREIAFEHSDSNNIAVYLMDAAGGNVRPVTSASGFHFSPAWRPRR